MKVLIADDSRTVRFVENKLLKELGFTDVVEAADVEEAKKVLAAGGVGLILSDWHMPGGTGLDFLKYVRATPSFADLPFIIITTEHEKKNIIEAVKAKVTTYLFKPITKPVLLEKLSALGSTSSVLLPQGMEAVLEASGVGQAGFAKHASTYDFGCEMLIEYRSREYPVFLGDHMEASLPVQLREMFGESGRYVIIYRSSAIKGLENDLALWVRESAMKAIEWTPGKDPNSLLKDVHAALDSFDENPVLCAFGDSEVLEAGALIAGTWRGGASLVQVPISLTAALEKCIDGLVALPTFGTAASFAYQSSMVWFDMKTWTGNELESRVMDRAHLIRHAFFCGAPMFEFIAGSAAGRDAGEKAVLTESFGRCIGRRSEIWDEPFPLKTRKQRIDFALPVAAWLYGASSAASGIIGALAFLVELGAAAGSIAQDDRIKFSALLAQLGTPVRPATIPDAGAFPGLGGTKPILLPTTPGTIAPVGGVDALKVEVALKALFG